MFKLQIIHSIDVDVVSINHLMHWWWWWWWMAKIIIINIKLLLLYCIYLIIASRMRSYSCCLGRSIKVQKMERMNHTTLALDLLFILSLPTSLHSSQWCWWHVSSVCFCFHFVRLTHHSLRRRRRHRHHHQMTTVRLLTLTLHLPTIL